MLTDCSENSSLFRIRTIAEYQFGRGAGEALFPEGCTFQYSTTGRIRHALYGKDRLATIRAQDGRLTLGIRGAERLHASLSPHSYRVVISADVQEFVSAGKNAFSRHVIAADSEIRGGDEVLVVDEEERLVATGTAMLSGAEMMAFKYGVAVKVRAGKVN